MQSHLSTPADLGGGTPRPRSCPCQKYRAYDSLFLFFLIGKNWIGCRFKYGHAGMTTWDISTVYRTPSNVHRPEEKNRGYWGLTSKSTTNPAVNTSKPIKTDFVMNDDTNENAYASAHVVEGIKGTYGQCNEECLWMYFYKMLRMWILLISTRQDKGMVTYYSAFQGFYNWFW